MDYNWMICVIRIMLNIKTNGWIINKKCREESRVNRGSWDRMNEHSY